MQFSLKSLVALLKERVAVIEGGWRLCAAPHAQVRSQPCLVVRSCPSLFSHVSCCLQIVGPRGGATCAWAMGIEVGMVAKPLAHTLLPESTAPSPSPLPPRPPALHGAIMCTPLAPLTHARALHLTVHYTTAQDSQMDAAGNGAMAQQHVASPSHTHRHLVSL